MTSQRPVLVAHQPAYLPWPGYFTRLMTDVNQLVLLDHVQFSERGWQHRNDIADRKGKPTRLSVPVCRDFGQRIADVHIADVPWARKHWRTLQHNYGRARFWSQWSDRLHAIYHAPWARLVNLDVELIRLLLDGLGIDVQLVRSSALRPDGTRTAMLADLCARTDTHVLRVGSGATSYLGEDPTPLRDAGITVEVATYTPVAALVPRGPVSALDALLHHGPAARELVRAGARTSAWTLTAKVTV